MASRDIIDVEMLASKFKTMPKPKNPIEAKAYLNRALALQSKIDRLWNRSPAGSDDAEYGEMLAEEFEPAFRLAEDLAEKFLGRTASILRSRRKASGEANVPGKHIFGKATVEGKAKVFGRAMVKGYASVYGNAKVSGYAVVSGDAKVGGTAQVFEDATVLGYAKVYGNARVYGNAIVSGYAELFGDTQVCGDAEIIGGKWNGLGPITSGRWKAPGVPADNPSRLASDEVKAPVTQSKVNAAMKALGLSSFKFLGTTKKGFQGGNFGPLTISDTFLRINKNTEDRVKNGLRSLGAKIQPLSDRDGFTASFNQGPDAFSYYLMWHTVPSGFDNPEYQTCWLTFIPRA
jgi:hypothetical protein